MYTALGLIKTVTVCPVGMPSVEYRVPWTGRSTHADLGFSLLSLIDDAQGAFFQAHAATIPSMPLESAVTRLNSVVIHEPIIDPLLTAPEVVRVSVQLVHVGTTSWRMAFEIVDATKVESSTRSPFANASSVMVNMDASLQNSEGN